MGRSCLFIAACVACCILYVCSEVPAGQATLSDDASETVLGGLFGYKPCLDENCEEPSETPDARLGFLPPDMDIDVSHLQEDSSQVNCILLQPNTADIFAEIESTHPGINSIKHKVLEELIEHMYPFATLQIGECGPDMKLVDLVILAANSLKTRYVLQGLSNCTYKSSESEVEPNSPGDNETEAPCGLSTEASEHVTQGSRPDCQGVTETPEASTSVSATEKPYADAPMEKPCQSKDTEEPCAYEKTEPCQVNVTEGQKDSYPESPCQKTEKVHEHYHNTEEIEIVAEDDYPPFVGSLRGIPGIHYPNYTDIPLTSFTCADKKYVPGFYADLETGCQVFHVCYEHRRESFLCPKGTTFNQPILACDFWYNYNCSLAYEDYSFNEKTEVLKDEKIDLEVKELVSLISEEAGISEDSQKKSDHFDDSILEKITPFLPIKAVVTELEPVEDVVKPVAKAEVVHKPIELKPKLKPPKMEPMNMEEVFGKIAIPLAKVKLDTIPVSKATAFKVAAKVALPVAKLAASKVAAVPLAAAKVKTAAIVPAVASKAKVAAALPFVAKTKLAVPVVAKAKIAAASVPIAKAKLAVPVVAKAKIAAASVPIAKAKLAVPVAVKSKIAVGSIPVVAKAKVAGVAPKVAAKAFIPVLKTKKVASAVPLAKAKVAPALKAKLIKGVGTPLLKAKVLSLPLAKTTLAGPIPLIKAKLAKTAAISPLTKKALALGYIKLLKAKKIPLMG